MKEAIALILLAGGALGCHGEEGPAATDLGVRDFEISINDLHPCGATDATVLLLGDGSRFEVELSASLPYLAGGTHRALITVDGLTEGGSVTVPMTRADDPGVYEARGVFSTPNRSRVTIRVRIAGVEETRDIDTTLADVRVGVTATAGDGTVVRAEATVTCPSDPANAALVTFAGLTVPPGPVRTDNEGVARASGIIAGDPPVLITASSLGVGGGCVWTGAACTVLPAE